MTYIISKMKQLWQATKEARRQGISMRRKLVLYWMSMLLAVFAFFLLLLSVTGVFSNSEKKLSDVLAVQQYNSLSKLSGQLNGLNAQCVALSETVSDVVSNTLRDNGASFDDLNDNQELIAEVEGALYGHLYSTLRASDCSGAFILLDATTNTKLENAENSRMGLYLRYTELDRTGSANQHLAYYRGVSEVARKQQVRIHNRWNLEFDTTVLPGYEEFMAAPVDRLADAGVWTGRVRMKDIWEDALLLYLPVRDWDGTVVGICGAELSELYFRLSYPSIVSDYGSMVTFIAPIADGQLLMDQAMLGDTTGIRLEPNGNLACRKGTYYNIYSCDGVRYIGLHQPLNCTSASGHELAVVTLISESGYHSISMAQRIAWGTGSAIFLLFALAVVLFLSRRFVRPILRSLQSAQETPEENRRSGVYEIDKLLALLQSQAGQKQMESGMSPELDAFFQDFTSRVKTLTPMERTVLQYYVDGYEIGEVAERAFISLNTAKKHNTNINKKLGTSSKNELMLYVDLLRRCGKLDQIIYHG